MVDKLKTSYKNINIKLFISLLIMGFLPTIYSTLRIYWLGNYPNEYSYSIAGQLTWINLIYEVINEAIILPLYYFVGSSLSNNKELTNRMKTGLLITLIVYCFLSVFIIVNLDLLLKLMATNPVIIHDSKVYISIEAIANIFIILGQFSLIGLLVLGQDRYVYLITVLRLFLCFIIDIFLVSPLTCSLNLGINGIAISNVIVNALICLVILKLLARNNIEVFNFQKMDFSWMKEFIKVGGISGLESLIRNLFYIIMIVRMVNVVNEQGTYWVANNFIWGWLLLPISQLSELIKNEISTDRNAIKNNTLGYFVITTFIIITWVIFIPLYKPFMQYILNFDQVEKLYDLVMILLPFYALYAFQNIFDATFYGLGQTKYMLFETVVTNCIYYGIAFILYLQGIWQPSLLFIALLFGIGNGFDSIVSLLAYWYLLKKRNINILR